MFGQEGNLSIEHEILKENHETLVKDYKSLEERIKREEETYEIMKKHLQSKSKELEVTNVRLFEGCERERSEKDKYKRMLEEMKSELVVKNQELLLAKRKKEQEFEKLENKYVELAEKFGVAEADCAYLKSLYDAKVAASDTPSAVMSGIGDTENLIGQGENEVNHNVNKAVTDAILISDESDAGQDDNPVRECNKSPLLSVDKNQEEQCKNRTISSNENQIFIPRSVNHPPPFSASPSSSSSSSSSSSDGYEVVVKLPDNWPDWAISKGPGEESNKP